MNIVIAGAGEVGANLAIRLRHEGHNVALIENDPETCKQVENLDVLMVQGSASDPDNIERAGIGDADYFVAVTGSDEVNLIGCTIAKFRKAKRILKTLPTLTGKIECLKEEFVTGKIDEPTFRQRVSIKISRRKVVAR